MRSFVAVVLVCCSASARECTHNQEVILNKLLGRAKTKESINLIISKLVPKTIGNCTGLNSSFDKCVPFGLFPVKRDIGLGKVEIDYITGLNSFELTDLAFVCDVANVTTFEKKWFMRLQGEVDGFRVPIHVHPVWGKESVQSFHTTDPLRVRLTLRPQAGCDNNETSFGIQFDPSDPDAVGVSDVIIDILGMKLNVTEEIKIAMTAMSHITLPEKLRPIMKLACDLDHMGEMIKEEGVWKTLADIGSDMKDVMRILNRSDVMSVLEVSADSVLRSTNALIV